MKKIFIIIAFTTILLADFIRDTNQIVKDTDTLLMWSDHEVVTLNWQDSISYCESLVLNGSSDWRVPNIQEILTLSGGKEVLDESYPNSLNKVFEVGSLSDDYWSSTSSNSYKNRAYKTSARYGRMSATIKTLENEVRCVSDF